MSATMSMRDLPPRGFIVRTLREQSVRYGATVENASGEKTTSYHIDAPAGKVWAASSTHQLAVE